jgi:hypothetical protein
MSREVSRKPESVDNTPYWATDSHRWDIHYMRFIKNEPQVTFDVEKEDTVKHILEAIHHRGDKIFIGFTYYDSKSEYYREYEIIKMAQFGGTICHACMWFGEHVTTLSAGRSIQMVQSPLEYCRWELVSLPFVNVPLAFRIAVDIVIKCNKEDICYNAHSMSVLGHVMARLFIPGHKEDQWVKGDYDANKPETWSGGVHCSQLTLLFLKRCIIHNALLIPSQHREMFLNTYSFTCLPASLRALVAKVWPEQSRAGDFRDYRDVGDEVRKGWYPHYFSRTDTKPFIA